MTLRVIEKAIGTMDRADESGAAQARSGTCHRCGWKGPVAKVSRRERRTLDTGMTYGRLCAECTADVQPGARSEARPHDDAAVAPIPLRQRSPKRRIVA